MSFVDKSFGGFLASPFGRAVRFLAGVALIGYGFIHNDQILALVLMVVGLLPFAASLLDVCVISRIFGGPLSGAIIRQRQRIRRAG